jgi:hypothetical protein
MELSISWQSIIDKFSRMFDEVYFVNNKQKLYFSFDERVEGAKDTWMLLAFTDGILQNLEPAICCGKVYSMSLQR